MIVSISDIRVHLWFVFPRSYLHAFRGISKGIPQTAYRFQLKDKPRLQLEHPRRVDVREPRERVRSRADTIYKRTEVRIWRRRVAVDRLPAAQHVGVIEDIE